MKTVYIKFLSKDDRIKGFYELITRATVPGAG